MKRILVIEDELFILELLTELLTHLGYVMEQAQSGNVALDKLDRGGYDAILLDIHLADMDGRVVYRKVQERFPSLAGRIVFMTGDLSDPNTASFIKESGNPCLEKPFTITQLDGFLRKVFHKKAP